MTSEEAAKREALPVGPREIAASVFVIVLFLLTQIIAVLLVNPFRASGVKGFEDPEDPTNALWLFVSVIVFTVAILWLARRNLDKVIQATMLIAIGITLLWVLYPLFDMVPTTETRTYEVAGVAVPFNLAFVLAAPPAALLLALLLKFPEWYVVDTVGVVMSAGVIAIFGGFGFTPAIYLIVLVVFAAYDWFSVYRTRHMLTLADKVLDLRIPILFVIPKTLDYSFLEDKGRARAIAEGLAQKKPRDALFVGLGDVIIPSILGVTALTQFPFSWGAAFGTFLGVAVGLAILLAFVLRGRPHAGLPLLNSGAFLGFLVGLYLDKGTIVFW